MIMEWCENKGVRVCTGAKIDAIEARVRIQRRTRMRTSPSLLGRIASALVLGAKPASDGNGHVHDQGALSFSSRPARPSTLIS